MTTHNSPFPLVVLGAGPGGYTAAFRAADLGLKVALIERHASLGGVCLNVGCIPSKALLHAAAVMDDAAEAGVMGVRFAAPKVDLAQMRKWKDGIVGQLTGGLATLAKKRGVEVIRGEGKFASAHSLEVAGADGAREVRFEQAIIAAGSAPVQLPMLADVAGGGDARVMDSTDALELHDIPKRLLVIGGGIIGLEMATVYRALGSEISIVEATGGLMPGVDADLLRPLQKRIGGQYANIWVNTKVTAARAVKGGIRVEFDGGGAGGGKNLVKGGKAAPGRMTFDKVLVCVGRAANGEHLNLAAAGLQSERGLIAVDAQQRTAVPHIFAIGDIVGQPMLAHKASHEGKVAAEVAAGLRSGFDARVIPSVAYTDPEVAWVGVTEAEAKRQGLDYGKGVFPWAASGRALSLGGDGVTKLLFDRASGRLIGAGISGRNAGDLINEAALAIEMGGDAEDIGLTIHAHPTLAETIGFAAEVFAGTVTDLYLGR